MSTLLLQTLRRRLLPNNTNAPAALVTVDCSPVKTLSFIGDGVTLAADAFGDPNDPPVLFFHGGGQSRRAWRGSARSVAKHGYYGVTFDLRGHGESAWATDGDYDVAAYGRDVACLIDQFEHTAALVGASRGGQVALIGAAARPQRVSLLVLADVVPRLRDYGVNDVRQFFSLSHKGFETYEEAAELLALLGHTCPTNADELARAMRRGDDGRYYWQWDPQSVAPQYLNPPTEGEEVESAAKKLTCPTVLVRAELSNLVTDEGVAHFRSVTPQLEVIVAKGVGHMFTGDRNDAFAATLIPYLSRYAPVTA